MLERQYIIKTHITIVGYNQQRDEKFWLYGSYFEVLQTN